jgi:hypothetical protein
MDSISDWDKSTVLEMTITVREMILLRLQALQSLDKNAAEKLYEMDDTGDLIHRRYLRKILLHVVIFLLY